jgi:IS30 family transposase
LAFKLGRERKTIKSELIRGKYQTLTNSIAKPTHTFSYSKDASDQHSKIIREKKSVQQTKILINQKLREYILNLLPTQSLKGIAGRIKKEHYEGSIDFCISHTSLYSYIENKRVE